MSDECPAIVDQLDMQIEMAVRKQQRRSEWVRRIVDAWEPGPCPPDWKPES